MRAHSFPRRITRAIRTFIRPFRSSYYYWDDRYAGGDTSGHGSEGELAIFKSEIINNFVANHNIRSVIEFGCGDGTQLELLEFPFYTGFDVSKTAIEICRKKFPHDHSKKFHLVDEHAGDKADMTISLDVILHLVEDQVFHEYMERLFSSAHYYVAIYSGNFDDKRLFRGPHVKHRKFTCWINQHAPQWRLIEHVPNKYPHSSTRKGSYSEFFFYSRIENTNQTL